VRRYRLFFNISKEEEWLNSLAKQGWILTRIGFGYMFEKAEPEDVNIRVDYHLFQSQSDYMNYITLFEDSGWRHMAGSKYSGSQYFKRVSADSDDIFSDTVSKAARYRRLSRMYLSMMMCFIALMIPFVINILNSGTAATSSAEIGIDFSFFDPKTWYFTPGLWELDGVRFWRAFLFETPFALGRSCSWLLPLVCIALYLVCAIKSHLLYKQSLRQ
jgi:hypothetical protein